MKIVNIVNYLENELIKSPAVIWDNVGLLCGDNNANVTSCLLSLDLTKDVLQEAIDKKCELIVNHHPVIFEPIKKLTADSILFEAAVNKINIFCAHTNLDATVEGINDELVKLFDVTLLENLEIDGLPLCKICELKEEMTSLELAKYVKEKLQLDTISYAPRKCFKENPTADKPIKKVAILCGGGNAGVEKIVGRVDAFITGEIKHENVVHLYNKNITTIQAGHFNTESVILSSVVGSLQKKFPLLDVSVAESNKGIAKFI